MTDRRGTAIITGVGRRRSIGAALALGLATDGWDLVLNHWTPYDVRLGLEMGADDQESIAADCCRLGSRVEVVSCDLAEVGAAGELVAAAVGLGELRGLVLSHCESVDSSTLDTTVESWDRHFAVNARASWLLIKAFAEALLTSDHVVHNLPYGASKGALDRLVIAAGAELGHRGIRANVIDPGPIDTGWMTQEIRDACLAATPSGRLGTPSDTANLVRFLFSDAGGWINAQLLHSDGGFQAG